MGTKYTLKVRNNSSNPGDICIHETAPVTTPQALHTEVSTFITKHWEKLQHGHTLEIATAEARRP